MKLGTIIIIIIIIWIIVITIFNTLPHNYELPSEGDIVIIGGGVAGCVVARRLHEKYPNKVIVILDRGKDYRNDRNIYRTEAALIAAYSEPYSEVIIPDFENVLCSIPRIFGGGSSHNYGLVVKGSDHFYQNNWLSQYNTTMDELSKIKEKIDSKMSITPLPVSLDLLPKILPAIKQLFTKGVTELAQGIDVIRNIGPLRANEELSIWIHDAIISESNFKSNIEVELVDDYNSGVGPCVCDTPQLFVDNVVGIRASVNRAYLPLRNNSTYIKVESTEVYNISSGEENKYQINLKDGRKILAREKVILAAGAIYSPFILLNSPQFNSNYYIGKNLNNHYGTQIIMAVKNMNDFSSGPMAFISNFKSSNFNKNVRNWQIVTSGSTLTNLKFLESQGVDVESYKDYNFITFLGWDLTPKTSGSISVDSSSIDSKPIIKLNLFENAEDNDSIVELFRYLGRIYNKMKETKISFELRLLFPQEQVFINDNYDELLANAKIGVSLTDHYNGSLRMNDVLNTDFSLKGHPNIHVVDASTFPSIPDGNTEYPTLIVAELSSSRI